MRHAITRVIATKADAPPKPEGLAARLVWVGENFKAFELRGHQDPATAIAYAAKRGYRATELRHEDLGIPDKPWSKAVVRVFTIADGKARCALTGLEVERCRP